MTEVERTRKEIFKKYPDAVIEFEYSDGEILFYENKGQSDNEANIHSGYMVGAKLVNTTAF